MNTADKPISRDHRRLARAEAAAWIVRLHGPDRSPELEQGLRSWLAADPENARQFERVTEVWDAGSNIPTAGVPRMARWQEPSSLRRWALAAMVLLVCGLGVWCLNDRLFNPSYSTRIGEQRIVRLSDGTRVSLNSNTLVRVAYRGDQRRVALERGEAYFEVARNPARPFIVVAGDHRVTAIGTAFVVRYERNRTAVTLVEGKVVVTPLNRGAPPIATPLPDRAHPAGSASAGTETRLLSPGQRLTFVGTNRPQLDEPRIDAVTAWRRGEVMLDSTMLADAVAEMNRYDEVMLMIDDPAVAALKVSGIYHAGDSNGFAQTLAELYGLKVVRQANRIHLRSAEEPAGE
jgi:transmembrane sensor